MFHTDIEIRNILQTDKIVIETHDASVFQSTAICRKDHYKELQEFKKLAGDQSTIGNKNSNIFGIAIKLSVLENLNLGISEVLHAYSGTIIIDAEFSRLDYWLDQAISNDLLKRNDLKRLILTVQVKRGDSKDQVENLEKYLQDGLRVLLVAGHQVYLEGITQIDVKLSSQFQMLANSTLVQYFGISSKFAKILNQKELAINDHEILELQGYHSIKGSMLWSYYAGKDLTVTALDYLSRRSGSGKFVCRDIDDIIDLSVNHSLVLFLDSCCKFLYINYLRALNTI